MEEQHSPAALTIMVGVITAVILPSLLCRPSDPSAELTRATREAVELVRDADRACRPGGAQQRLQAHPPTDPPDK
jgi:hypothetical protein